MPTKIPPGPRTYPRAARWLHWLMALGIIWVLFTACLHALANKSALDQLLWPTHKHVGALMGALAVLRLLLALAQRAKRPHSLNLPAALGHLGLYALILAVPAIGLMRQYGSGRAFSPLGLPLMPAQSDRVEWMVALGNAWHGNLGWVLLALVVGHVGMVFVHLAKGERFIWERMAKR